MKLQIAFMLFTASLMANPITYTTTAILEGVNGNFVIPQGANYSLFTGPYDLNLGGQDIKVWCIDPNVISSIGDTYQAQVTVGLANTVQMVLVEGIIQEAGNSTNPSFQEAIYHVVDPSQWGTDPTIDGIINIALNSTTYTGGFEEITGNGEQSYVARVPASPEPATWGMFGIGGLFLLIGRMKCKSVI